ncbi:hypothetical protein OS493_039300, partial [Desmophyllum pertusum]
MDFTVALLDEGPSPNWTEPNDGSCEEVPDGDTFYSIIEAKHIDSSRRIAEIITVTTTLHASYQPLELPLITSVTTVYYKNVSWNPKLSQKGRHIFCFKAIDEYGMESDERCITILVGSINTVIFTYSHIAEPLIMICNGIKRPRHSKFIQIILEGHVIYKLDTRSSSDVTINQAGLLTLQFRVPQVVLRHARKLLHYFGSRRSGGPRMYFRWAPFTSNQLQRELDLDVGVCAKGTFIDHSSYNCNDVDECSNPPSILSRKKKKSLLFIPFCIVLMIQQTLLGIFHGSTAESSSNLRTTDITPSSELRLLNESYSNLRTTDITPSSVCHDSCTLIFYANRKLHYLYSFFIFDAMPECSNHSYLEEYNRGMDFYASYSASPSATSMTTTQESYSNLRTTDITPSSEEDKQLKTCCAKCDIIILTLFCPSAFSAAIASTVLASANYSAMPSATSMTTTQELRSSISTSSQATPAMYSSPKMLIST